MGYAAESMDEQAPTEKKHYETRVKNGNTETKWNEQEIVFVVGDRERMKITPHGFFVDQRFVVEDREVYDVFREWLAKATTGGNNG